MQPRLACADFTFPLLPHDKVLDLIAMLELEGVDLGLFEGRSHLWPSREFRDVAGSSRALATKLGDRGLSAADIFLQMDPDFVPFALNHPDPAPRQKARDWFLKALEYARGAGAPHVTVLPGVNFVDREPAADSLSRTRDELAWRVQQAQDHGVILGVEAHVGSIVSAPEPARRLVESVPGLTLTLDYTHFTRAGTPDEQIEPLVLLSSHFHCRGARAGRLQASFKDNTIDYARVWRVMQETGYRGYVGIEYVWIDWEHCNESDNLSETIQYRDFFRKLD